MKSNKENFGFFIWGYFTLHVNKIKQNKLDVHQVLNNIGVPGVCQKVQKKCHKRNNLRESNLFIAFARIFAMTLKRSAAVAYRLK